MTRQKLVDILLVIFGWGVFLCLIAGGLSFFGFLVAIIMNGSSGTAIATFIQKQYFPIVIRVASIIIMLGLFTMYLRKEQSLSLVSDKKDADADIQLSKETIKGD